MTEVEELGWTKEMEKQGYYNDGGRVVARWKCISIPTAMIPEDACTVYHNTNRDGDKWQIFFTHPSFPEVPEGDECPTIELKETS